MVRVRSAVVLVVLLMSFLLVPTVAKETIGDDDAGSGTDAGDTPQDALPITPGFIAGRTLWQVDQYDHYRLDVDAGVGIEVIGLPDPDTGRIPPVNIIDPNGQHQYQFEEGLVRAYTREAGAWVARVNFSPYASDYSIEVRVVDLQDQDDADSGNDALGYYEKGPRPKVTAETFSGEMNPYDLWDAYSLEVTEPSRVSVAVETESEDIMLVLRGSQWVNRVGDGGKTSLFAEGDFDEDIIIAFGPYWDPWDERPPFAGGNYTFTIMVEPLSNIALPDLRIDGIWEEPAPASNSTIWGTVDRVEETRLVHVHITNAGNSSIEDELYLGLAIRSGHHDEPSSDPRWHRTVRLTASIPAGETVGVTFEWHTWSWAGDLTLQVEGDVYYWNGQVTESDETNNWGLLQTWVKAEGLGTGV